jgi:hypothetical protein
MTLKWGLRLLLMALAPWLLWQAAIFLFDIPSVNGIFLILLGIAFVVPYERLLQKLSFPASFEIGFSVIVGIICLLGIMQGIISPMLEAEDIAAEPCAPQTLQSQCYTMPHSACTSIWTQYEKECRDQIEAIPENNKVGALLGSQIQRCTRKKFDRSFKSARRLMSNSECYQLFNSLDQ